MKIKISLCILVAVFIALPAAQAGTKEEMIRLENEIITLQKQFLDFNESNNERLDGLRSLIVQLNDQIAKSNSALSRLGVSLDSRTEDARSQDSSLRAEIRELKEKINDTAISITALAQQFNEYKLQAAMRPAAASSLSAENMYTQAFRDFQMEDYDIAIDGFTAIIELYPGGETAAKSWLYIGESYSAKSELKEAVEAFTRVINGYPQASVVPTALFKRAKIATALQDYENAIADYKDIVERFPTAAEAGSARAEIQLLDAAQKSKPQAKTPAKPASPVRKPAGR